MSDNVLVVETPLLATGCILGEGPLYDPETKILHFVDINQKRVYHCNTETLDLTVDQFDEAVTALALRQGGQGVSNARAAPKNALTLLCQLACATASGFGVIEKDENSNARLVPLITALSDEELLYTRLNDGACDARGRFLAATIESKHPGHEFGGTLYQYDPKDGSCKVLDTQDITDGNGLGWSEDNKTLYFTNSCINEIYAYDYDLEDGSVSNRRTFIDGPSLGLHAPSFCDGLCFDSEGCL